MFSIKCNPQPTPGVYMTSDQELTELPMAMGDAWSRMRRILSPSFSVFKLKAVNTITVNNIMYETFKYVPRVQLQTAV